MDKQASSIVNAFEQAVAHQQAGRWIEAERLFQKVLEFDPKHPQALYRLGLIQSSIGRLAAAIEYFDLAIAIEPWNADFHLDRGMALDQLGWPEDAIAAYQQSIQLRPHFVEALNILGAAWRRRGELEPAVDCYRRAIQYLPTFAEAHNNLGVALQDQEHFADAAAAFQSAIELRPDLIETHYNLGNVLRKIGRLEDAGKALDRALELRPDFAAAFNCKGRVWHDLKNYEAAIEAHQQALRLQPTFPEALYDLGLAYETLGQAQAAANAYEKAIEQNPKYVQALDGLVHQLQHLCQWEDLNALNTRLLKFADEIFQRADDPRLIAPFTLLALHSPTTPQQQYYAARNWCRQYSSYESSRHIPCAVRPMTTVDIVTADGTWNVPATLRIRIGFLSSDFRDHPVAWLLREMIASLNRSSFDVFGYDIGSNDESSIGHQIRQAFDSVRSLRDMDNKSAIECIKDDKIDILIDLNGLTQHARPSILAGRAAPIQVNYLGYPSTTGGHFIDYILVDEFIVPADQQPYFSERLVHLPGCYMPYDRHREIDLHMGSRSDAGLSQDAFILCAFSPPYKISQQMFGAWMRLLSRIPNCRLWLRDINPWAKRNLQQAAVLGGVPSDRLIFAPKVDMPQHLARHRLADVFLDTFPYNQHSTACDALRMGLPVVTWSGDTFASRVAGSLLKNLDVPELIASDLSSYEATVIRLATHRDELKSIRSKLSMKAEKDELFDGQIFARKIEMAFQRMWAIHQRGEPARGFAVEASAAR